MSLEANKEIVCRYQRAWEQADLATLDELLTKDFVNHSLPLPPDRAGILEFAAQHRRQFPTGTYTIRHLIAEGDLVAVFGHHAATHDGEPFQGIPASGVAVRFDYFILLRLENGQIAEHWGASDDIMGMLVPLGFKLVPPGE